MDSIWDKDKIAKARSDSKMTAPEAAERLNITPEYIYMIEAGKKRPGEDLVAAIASLYDLPIAYFLKNDVPAAKT